MQTIAVLMTCHNRRDKTLACLEALFANHVPEGYAIKVFLVDDGSTDGTGAAVAGIYPDVKVIQGDGNLYWNGGMRVAFASAMNLGFDFYLWLNDDTFLFADAVRNMLETYVNVSGNDQRGSIIVGSTCDAITGLLTYGGEVHFSRWKRLALKQVQPGTKPVPCHTMNGNFVLIPAVVAARLGNLGAAFMHAMGDTDYGLRAIEAGINLWLAPGYIGMCGHNSQTNTYHDKSLSLAKRFTKILDVKGLPIGPWYAFTTRHGGFLWPLYFMWPYAKVAFSGLLNK
jgi:GT2 family glycosyltransferase